MIKLASPTNAPVAFTVLTPRSKALVPPPSINLSTKEAGSANEKREWSIDGGKLKQVVSYMGAAGALDLEGTVDADKAVEITGAFKVVLEVAVKAQLSVARSAGQVSRGIWRGDHPACR